MRTGYDGSLDDCGRANLARPVTELIGRIVRESPAFSIGIPEFIPSRMFAEEVFPARELRVGRDVDREVVLT